MDGQVLVKLPWSSRQIVLGRPRWRRWLVGAGALLLTCSGVSLSGLPANLSRSLRYRQLPDFNRSTERRLMRQLAAKSVARPAAAAPAIDYARLPNGQVRDATIPSGVLGRRLTYRIYLPPGYDDPRLAGTRYPVVYLLHGAPGNHRDWVDGGDADQITDALIKTDTIPPLILVMPDGSLGNPRHDTQWGNSPVTGERVEDALVADLVPAIDHAYRTIPTTEARAIGGLSSGGFGALNIALHHPEVFSVACSLTGYYTPERTYDGRDLWGSAEARARNAPAQEADGQPLHLYIAAGQDAPRHLAAARSFSLILSRQGMDHQLAVFPGEHGWAFWRAHLADALRYSARYLAAPQPQPRQGETPQ